MSSHDRTETITSAERYSLFKECYRLDENNVLFQKYSFQISSIERKKYRIYFEELVDFEANIIKDSILKGFNSIEKNIIFEIFPVNYFLDTSFDFLYESSYFKNAETRLKAANMDYDEFVKNVKALRRN